MRPFAQSIPYRRDKQELISAVLDAHLDPDALDPIPEQTPEARRKRIEEERAKLPARFAKRRARSQGGASSGSSRPFPLPL